MSSVPIGNKLLGPGEPTFIIAEIGVNHDGSVQRAIELVQHAAAAGADAVKLQIFRADALMNASSTFAEYQRDHVDAADPIAMLRQYEFTIEELRRIVKSIIELDLIPLATPFSPRDIDLIDELDLPAIKIASPDLVNRVLLERAAKTGKPMIVSTGAASRDEVEATTIWLRNWRIPFVLMHCVSSYPTPSDQAHLGWISELARFGAPVGYSDHTINPHAGAMAVAAGACAVEKHLTYDRNAAGPDHSASADPIEFAEYVRWIRAAEELRGKPGKCVLPIERDVRSVSRQSLVLARDVAQGHVISSRDVTVQRPGTGIEPAKIELTMGKVARLPLRRGTILQWDMLADAA